MTDNNELSVVEQVAVMGDLAVLSPAERWEYYKMLCEATGLSPVTRPFGYIKRDDGKLELYAKRMATDQLRAIHGVDITDVNVEYQDDWIIVTAKARDKTGRQDIDIGAAQQLIGFLTTDGFRNHAQVFFQREVSLVAGTYDRMVIDQHEANHIVRGASGCPALAKNI